MQKNLPSKDVVLLGLGHTNTHVLRMWRMKRIRDAQLTCVSDFSIVTYSGMLPGVLAGQYPPKRMEIDLVRLCAAVGARLIVGEVTGLDVDNRQIHFEDRPSLPFDVLSIGVGSVPRLGGAEFQGGTVLPIKPMQTFLRRFQKAVEEKHVAGRPLRVTIVGGGVGGNEIAFCLPARLRSLLGDATFQISLVDAHDRLAAGTLDKTADLVKRLLEERGVRTYLGRRVETVDDNGLSLEGGELVESDLIVWATGAAPSPLLTRLKLPTDKRGFLLTRPTLQTTADAPIFVVGDCGTIEGSTTPKAGVYAVRQGPILWQNIRHTLQRKPLKIFKPQKGFLKLINTGDGKAIAEYLGMTIRSRLSWWIKDGIDRKFMDKYQDYRPMEMKEDEPKGKNLPMRCAGCGGKVSGSVLSRVLSRLEVTNNEHVLLGLDLPDDAAVVRTFGNRPLTVTVDFFSAPLDDPFLVGRIAALNALSDVFAMGAKPVAALTMATIPVGKPRHQEQLLYELMSGSLTEFRRCDTALVGGHTIESPQITIGFTILAEQEENRLRRKADLRTGDRLVLTKPLGTGVLLAANMQALCNAEDMEALLQSMLLSNGPAASLVPEFDVAGVTDITGFGLAGHLLEMLQASRKSAELDLDAIPLLPGVASLIESSRVESTLAPANRTAEEAIDVEESERASVSYAAVFDPQTSGGLLLGVPEEHVNSVLERLRLQSDIPPVMIGKVVDSPTGTPRIRVGRSIVGEPERLVPVNPSATKWEH